MFGFSNLLHLSKPNLLIYSSVFRAISFLPHSDPVSSAKTCVSTSTYMLSPTSSLPIPIISNILSFPHNNAPDSICFVYTYTPRYCHPLSGGPQIFRNIFLYNVRDLFTSVFLNGQLSDPNRITGRISVVRIRFFSFLDDEHNSTYFPLGFWS